ncbi:MAG: hypothetical protein ABFR75_12430 [Acidobacteriota bacterium]
MKRYIVTLILLALIFIMYGCSTAYINPRLDDFHDATETVGDSVIKIFSELQSEEMNLIAEKAVNKQRISPGDLEPGVFTFKYMRVRKELVGSIVNYTKMLSALFETDHREELKKYTKIVEENLNMVSAGNPGLFREKEKGFISAISLAIPEALSYAKKRKFILKMMKNVQPLIKKISEKLADELLSAKILADNFYLRLFREKVAEQWPEKISKRLKYSKLGVQIVRKKRRTSRFIEEVIKALKMIPATHLKIRESLEKNKNVYFALKELINYGYRVRKSYEKFSGKGG